MARREVAELARKRTAGLSIKPQACVERGNYPLEILIEISVLAPLVIRAGSSGRANRGRFCERGGR